VLLWWDEKNKPVCETQDARGLESVMYCPLRRVRFRESYSPAALILAAPVSSKDIGPVLRCPRAMKAQEYGSKLLLLGIKCRRVISFTL
jgi:hypothetical protein